MPLTIDGNVAQSSCAVVLHVGIWRVEQANEDRNRAGID